MVVREGSNVSLSCAATGSPTPNITWRREDNLKILLDNGLKGTIVGYIIDIFSAISLDKNGQIIHQQDTFL